MPQHKDILVSKAHGDAPEHEHVMVAIKDAFAAAQRQIKDCRSLKCAARSSRNEAENHAQVAKFVASEGMDLSKPPMAVK